MDLLAGLLAAFLIVGLGKATRQNDAIPFYSTVLIVIALVYVLFAVMSGRASTLIAESLIAGGFVGVAVAAARWDRTRPAGLLIAAGLGAHGHPFQGVTDFDLTFAWNVRFAPGSRLFLRRSPPETRVFRPEGTGETTAGNRLHPRRGGQK